MKAALYVRVSTSHQIDKDSLPFQRKELINYSKYFLGIDDYEVFEDAGYSGKNTDRPKFQEMMSRIKAGEFSHMLVWKIDRISRNLKDFTTMYEELKDYGTTFISKNEQFDTSSAMGEAMLKIILVFAELERNLTAERVYSIMLDRASDGKWNGAPIPLGYKWSKEKKFPVVDDEESKTVKLIFDSYERLKSTGEVKHVLEREGIKTKRNGNWTTKTIADVIRNPFYIGTYRYNYRYSPHGKKRPENEWVVVKDNHDAIISKEQYERTNTIMTKNANGRGGNRSFQSHIHIFKGLVSCGKCNKNYIAATDRPRSNGYKPSVYRCFNYVHSKKQYRICNGNLGEVKLGPFVINYIANLILAYDLVKEKKNKVTNDDLEKVLLKGPAFKNIAGISNVSEIRDILLSSLGELFGNEKKKEPTSDINFKKDKELNTLSNEKKKIERALDRLENLYFFDDNAMAEKDYLIKKKKFEKQVDKINSNIKKVVSEYSQSLPGHDLSFMKKATKYLLGQVDITKPIDYNQLVSIIDKTLLQGFMQCNIKKIVIEEDRTISSITFINGMVHRFVHRDF